MLLGMFRILKSLQLLGSTGKKDVEKDVEKETVINPTYDL